MSRPQVRGAKGVALLGYAMVSVVFGLALLSPWALIPPPPRGLVFLDSLIPLQWWGALWWAAAVMLTLGAFRRNQAKSLGLFAACLFVWSTSYGFSAFTVTGPQSVAFTLQAAVFAGLLCSVLATARLLATPPVNIVALRARLIDELVATTGETADEQQRVG